MKPNKQPPLREQTQAGQIGDQWMPLKVGGIPLGVAQDMGDGHHRVLFNFLDQDFHEQNRAELWRIAWLMAAAPKMLAFIQHWRQVIAGHEKSAEGWAKEFEQEARAAIETIETIET